MMSKSWIRLNEIMKIKKKEIESKVIGAGKHLLSFGDLVDYMPLMIDPPKIPEKTEEQKRNDILYKRMKEFHDEIMKNMEPKEKGKKMMYSKESPDPIQEEPFRNRKARRTRAKELRRKDKKGKKK